MVLTAVVRQIGRALRVLDYSAYTTVSTGVGWLRDRLETVVDGVVRLWTLPGVNVMGDGDGLCQMVFRVALVTVLAYLGLDSSPAYQTASIV